MATPSRLEATRHNYAVPGRFTKRLWAIAALILVLTPARAELPPPINLHVWTLSAEGPVWPWAMVARQIIAWKQKGVSSAPPQCALVAMAQGAPPTSCCGGVNPACNITGSMQQIQMLIASFGASSSLVAPPKHPMDLYAVLASGRPMILQITSGIDMSHAVVLQGMEWQETPSGPRALLYIGDPMNFFPAPVPYENIAPLWLMGIAVN